MKKLYEHNHQGHRQRLKDKVRKVGLNALSEHEVLELLLTYSIPYKDTNELAHGLINRYSSFDKVIDADYNDLLSYNGIGEETALFLKILSQFHDIYNKSKKDDNCIINNTKDAISYFRKHYSVKSVEMSLIMCLSKTRKIVGLYELNGMSELEVNIDIKNIASIVGKKNTNSVILFHTHPSGDTHPSNTDIEATKRIYDVCTLLGVYLDDHIIINETDHYSFGVNGLLAKMQTSPIMGKYANLRPIFATDTPKDEE